MKAGTIRVGLISDTHDLVRPEAVRALGAVDRILHAGDICSPGVLAELAAIAPVTAVRGNNDRGSWAEAIPVTRKIVIGTVPILMIHNIDELDCDPAVTGCDVVVYGHSHRPSIERRGGVLFVNPGSAGPRRFSLPVSVGVLEIADGIIDAKLKVVDLNRTGERK
jgi:uncharacterized protein